MAEACIELWTSLLSQLLCCHFKLVSCWNPRGTRGAAQHRRLWLSDTEDWVHVPELSVGKPSLQKERGRCLRRGRSPSRSQNNRRKMQPEYVARSAGRR